MSNWIRLVEKRPDFNVPVLVCDVDTVGSISIARLVSCQTTEGEGFINVSLEFKIDTSFEDYYYCATHWMPLPSQPTQTDGGEGVIIPK